MPIRVVHDSKKKKKKKSKKKSKRVATHSLVNPNDAPHEHFLQYGDLPEDECRICMAFDVSGSQQGRGGQALIKQLNDTAASSMDKKTHMYPFGDDKVMPSFTSVSKFLGVYPSDKRFSYSTYVKSINNLLRNINGEYNKIVILGDGDFDGWASSSQAETKKFLDNLKLCDFTGVQDIVILFSPHTSESVMIRLKDSILEILGKEALRFTCIKLEYDERAITSILANISYSVKVSPGYALVGDMFAFHRKMTDANVAKVIREKYPDITDRLFEYIKDVIQNKPTLLLSPDNIFSRLHNILKILKGEDYKDWISLEKKNATGDRKETLKEFIEKSFSREAECRELYEKVAPYCIGYLRMSEVSISGPDLLKIVRDNSCIELRKFVKNTLSNAVFIKRRAGEPVSDRIGMLVIRPMNKMDGLTLSEYRVIARKALQTYLFQFGPYALGVFRRYILGMLLMYGMSTAIPKPVHNMIHYALFDDRAYTCKMLGFTPGSEELDLNDVIWTPQIMKIISGAIVVDCDKMFAIKSALEPDEKESSDRKSFQELVDLMKSYRRIHDIVETYRSLTAAQKVISRTLMEAYKTKNTINVGDMLSVNPWNKEKQPNLPAIVVVVQINDLGKGKSKLYVGEYLDQERDGTDRYKLNEKNVKIICKSPGPKLVSIINKHLMSLQKRGASGELGPEMLTTASRTGLRAKNDQIIMNMIKANHPTGELGFREVEKQIEIPSDIINQIIQPVIKANPHLGGLLKSGAKLTKDDTIKSAGIYMTRTGINDRKIFTFKYRKEVIVLLPREVKRLRKTFTEALLAKKSDGAVASNMKTCSVCFSDEHLRDMSYFNRCQHPICNDCRGHYNTHTEYGPGDVVNKALHVCALSTCRQVDRAPEDIMAVIKKHGGAIPGNIALKYCKACKNLFEHVMTCGAQESDIPEECTKCMVVDETAKKCPFCEILVSKSDGCDHMKCHCGGHWCWVCRRKFSDDIIGRLGLIDWRCSGRCTREDEVRYLEDPNYDSDGWP